MSKIWIAGDTSEDTVTDSTTGSMQISRIPSGAELTKTVFTSGESVLKSCDLVATSSSHPSRIVAKSYNADRGNPVVRIESYQREKSAAHSTQTVPFTSSRVENEKILILHHAEDHDIAGSKSVNDAVAAHAIQDRSLLPSVFVKLLSIPAWRPVYDRDDRSSEFVSPVWEALRKIRHQVCIITCASTLRHDECVLSRRLSYERIVEDLCAEIHRNPGLRLLATFEHLFVRIGMIAIVHIRRCIHETSLSRFEGELYFDPTPAQGLHRNEDEEGFTLGRNTVLLSHIVRHMIKDSSISKRTIQEACSSSISAMRTMDDAGYTGTGPLQDRIIRSLSEACHADIDTTHHKLSCARIPERILSSPHPQRPVTDTPWHILDNVLRESPVHRINVAMAIAYAGHEKVLNRQWDPTPPSPRREVDESIFSLLTRVEYWNPSDRSPDFVTLEESYEPAMPMAFNDSTFSRKLTRPIKIFHDNVRKFWLDVPLFKLADHILIERGEIESFRRVRNLLQLYCNRVEQNTNIRKNREPPISIAIFGSPGTGKSYIVKKLTDSLSTKHGRSLKMFTVNIGQIESPSAFEKVLTDIDAHIKNWKGEKHSECRIPVIFFDEFDSSLNGIELAWLKHYLAIMQDGSWGTLSIQDCILVFAGGTRTTFEQFDPRTDSAFDNLRAFPEYHNMINLFCQRKGPDFVSRLRGNIDILPINNSPGRPKHFIRRAMALRSIFARNGYLGQDGLALVSNSVIYAMLTTDQFLHGIRSMEAIIGMCSPIHGRIEIASLPAEAQLDMHVDAVEFMIRIHRGRERTWPEWKYASTGAH